MKKHYRCFYIETEGELTAVGPVFETEEQALELCIKVGEAEIIILPCYIKTENETR